MLIRVITLVVCQLAIIAVSVFIYDAGWSNLALDMQIILPTIGGIAFLLIALLVFISEEKIIQMNHSRNVQLRAKGIAKRPR
jgi:cytochrome c oxidase subunit IV